MVKVSLSITNYTWPREESLTAWLGALAEQVDQSQIDTLWFADHLLQADPNSSPEAETLEAYTTLAYVACCTRRVRLGAMVSAATYRAPAMLIKIVTTLDVLSGGRAWLGVGAGYHEQEARALGLELPPQADRYESPEDTLELALRMWCGDDSPFHGRRHRLERPILNPPPLTRPHPPILIGGMGERKTLRLVARYGDACNLFDIPDGGETIQTEAADARRPLPSGRALLRRD